MDCGTPFCHTGHIVSGMASGCPVNNLIPEWNDLIFRGRWKEALERLHKTNNFPEFTGRVCPAPCEGSCVLGVIQPPVTIKNNECAIIDRGWEEGWVTPKIPAKRTGKKVAVVGSGPAGLACADQLNQAGHSVTVFEREDRIGGLLMYGIPNMKLDKEEVVTPPRQPAARGRRRFQDRHLRRQGPEMDRRTPARGIRRGRALLRRHPRPRSAHRGPRRHGRASRDGVSNRQHPLAAGPPVRRQPPGAQRQRQGRRGHRRRRHRHRLRGHQPAPRLQESSSSWKSCPNRRWNAPPTTRGPSGPRFTRWTTARKKPPPSKARDPRHYLVQTKRFLKDDAGNLSGLEICEIEWAKDDQGRFMPKEKPGTARVIPAQLALLAMGFLGPEQEIVKQFALATDARSNVKAEHGKFTTNLPGVFAAGDMRRGQSLVVWAINEGRGAARECDRFLMGATHLP